MAEFDHTLASFPDGNGVLQMVAVCEDSQTEPDSEGDPSPLVVRIRVQNSTGKRGIGRWLHANGQLVTATVLPGENTETNISPPRRVGLHRLAWSLAMTP